MARSITYWYNIMANEKSTKSQLSALEPNIDTAQDLLTDLRSTSKVARWRLLLWVVATGCYALDVVMEFAISVLKTYAANARFGTLPWYVSISKAYQHGDPLVQINDEFVYATIDETKQIVALAAASEGDREVNLKVAKIVSDVTQKLSSSEKTAFAAYIKKRKPAGVPVNIISDDPDLLKLLFDIKYDPLVLTSTGEEILNSGVFPVEDAVESYLKSLPFDGRIEIMKLIDAIQQANGVVTVYCTSAEGKYGANPYTSFDKYYDPNAGYAQIDPDYLLADTVTYTANA